MKKLDSDGFSIVEVLIVLAALILISGAAFYVYKANNNESSDNSKKGQQSAQTDESTDETSIPEGYKEYKNMQYKFSFAYPGDWVEQSAEETLVWGEQAIVSLISPKTAAAHKSSTEQGIFGSANADLVVSRWDSINEPGAKGGEWIGQNEYSSLEDYFNDPYEGRSKQKIGELLIADQKAYEVIVGGHGAEYGIMMERAGAVYELRFLTIGDKASVTEEAKKIIESLRFY